MNYKIIILLLLITSIITGQSVNIIPHLKKVEAGKIEEVKESLLDLKTKYKSDPNVIFLEAVITENGEKSKKLYEIIYNNFPGSKFADAALFRVFSYYYALGLYKKAEELKTRLSTEFPKSPYLKNTERDFPQDDEMIVIDSTPYKLRPKGGFKFTVQAGAFSNLKNAEELKQKFLSDGLISKIKPKNVNNIRFQIVTVGNFNTRSEANIFLSTLQNRYSLKGRVIEIN